MALKCVFTNTDKKHTRKYNFKTDTKMRKSYEITVMRLEKEKRQLGYKIRKAEYIVHKTVGIVTQSEMDMMKAQLVDMYKYRADLQERINLRKMLRFP